MWTKVLLLSTVVSANGFLFLNDTVGNQLLLFKKEHKVPIGLLTTSAGAPIEFLEASDSINDNLIHNEAFMDTMLHLNRIRIPARMVHAKAAGAFGYFTVTHDITDICKADMFSKIGKKTPLVVRFSPVFTEIGGADTGNRETRGISTKFYTDEGNFDLITLDMPVFFLKDPIMFPSFVNAFNRNPKTNVPDFTAVWDFLTLRPETLHAFIRVFSDIGIPDGYRFMPGFGIHTFQLVNSHGYVHFVKFHLLPDGGVRTLSAAAATRLAGEEPNYAIRDLYDAIGVGKFPSWTLSVQVMSMKQVKNAKLDVFDPTRVWPLEDYPLKPVGKLVLNKNPNNYFADIEQLAFCVGNLVPGILGGPDKLFEGRRLSYRDAQNYRLGVNFNKIEVNNPHTKVLNYLRDGRAPVRENMKDAPNYYPNTYHGPQPYHDKHRVRLVQVYTDPRPTNFGDINHYYSHEISERERSRLIENLATTLVQAAQEIQERAVKLFAMMSRDLAERMSRRLWNVTVSVDKILPKNIRKLQYLYGVESVTKIICDEHGHYLK